MKHISLYTAALLTAGIGLTACDQLHNDLRLDPPTSYKLEVPEGLDRQIIFGATGSNVNNQLEVVTINPYNVNTTVDYQVQVASSEEAFETWDNLVADANTNGGSGDYDFENEDGLPYVVTVSSIFLSPTFTVQGADFCDAINALYGFESEADIVEDVQVAYRVHAWIPGVNYSSIFSNVVTLEKVKSYIPLREPRKLYLVGAPQEWKIDNDSMYLLETGIGTDIYKGTFTIEAGQFQFRFYSELGDWNANSIGATEGYTDEDDHPVEIAVDDDKYFGEIYNGKGSWQYTGWEGGKVEITIDRTANTIDMILRPGDTGEVLPTGNVLYLVGAPQGWDINKSSMYAEETSTGSNIYEGVFNIAAGEFQFRFYSALGDWETNSVGAGPSDGNVSISFTDGVFEGPVYVTNGDVLGKDNWQCSEWQGGTIKVTINLNNNTIKMEEYVNRIYVVGSCQGWDINSDVMPLYETEAGSNIFSGTYNIEAGTLQFKIYTELGNWDTHVYGSTEDGADVNTEIKVPYTGKAYPGKGNWQDSSFSGEATITLNMETLEISITN